MHLKKTLPQFTTKGKELTFTRKYTSPLTLKKL